MNYSKKIAAFLSQNHKYPPAMRTALISGIIKLTGKELLEALVKIKIIRIYSSAGGLDVLRPDGDLPEIALNETVKYMHKIGEDFDPEVSGAQFFNRIEKENLVNKTYAILLTTFGGAVVYAERVSALWAIQKWHIRKPKKREWWREDRDVLKTRRNVFAKLNADSLFNPLARETKLELALRLAKIIESHKAIPVTPDLFEISAWLEFSERHICAGQKDSDENLFAEPGIKIEQYLREIKSPNLEAAVVNYRSTHIYSEILEKDPEWPNVMEALHEREIADPFGSSEFEDFDTIVAEGLARVGWDIDCQRDKWGIGSETVMAEWPTSAILQPIFANPGNFRMSYGRLGPKAIRWLRHAIYHYPEPSGSYMILDARVPFPREDCNHPPRLELFWNGRTGELEIENGDAEMLARAKKRIMELDRY